LHLQRTIGNQAVLRLLQAKRDGIEAVSDGTAASRFGHDVSPIPVRTKAPVKIQSKLEVDTAGNLYEQEADRVSELVMRRPEPQLQRACACGGGCLRCQNEQAAHEHLQAKRVPKNASSEMVASPVVDEVLSQTGQPLDAPTRALTEPRLGHSFEHVRIHTNAAAAASAAALDAAAYTVGNHVVFGDGRFAPESAAGRRLLTHELVHVRQQEAGRVPAGQVLRTAENNCTPATMGVNNPDGVIGNGFRSAVFQVEEAISLVDAALGGTPPRWYSRRKAAIIVNYIFRCPTATDHAFIRSRLNEMRARLAAGFPYRCSTAPASCVPDIRGRRWFVDRDRVLAGGRHPGFLVTHGAVLCPEDLHDAVTMVSTLVNVAARFSGLRDGHRGDLSAWMSYEDLSSDAGRRFAADFGESAAAAGPLCARGSGIPIPDEPRELDQHEEHRGEPRPAQDRSEHFQSQWVYLNDDTCPTSWSYLMMWPFGLPGYYHITGQLTNFVRLNGTAFNLNPGGTVTERSTNTCPRR